MSYKIRDPFGKLMGMKVKEVTQTGVTTIIALEEKHMNPYGIVHGGVAYSMGCVTACLAAEFCLGRVMEVENASSQYLAQVTVSPMCCTAELLADVGEKAEYQVTVLDGKGTMCFYQIITLKPGRPIPDTLPEFHETLTPAGEDAPVHPLWGFALPHRSESEGFEGITNHFLMDIVDDTVEMAADIYPDTCDVWGGAHCGLIYTCSDSSMGVFSVIRKGAAVTVSSHMEYLRPCMVGPVVAHTHSVRQGKIIEYYQVEVTDGTGQIVAVGQFTLHPVQMDWDAIMKKIL